MCESCCCSFLIRSRLKSISFETDDFESGTGEFDCGEVEPGEDSVDTSSHASKYSSSSLSTSSVIVGESDDKDRRELICARVFERVMTGATMMGSSDSVPSGHLDSSEVERLTS